MINDPFEDFLKDKNKADQKPDFESRKIKWLKSVDSFYKEIIGWLKPFTEKQLLRLEKKNIQISEEFLGYYDVQQLDIYVGGNIISLIPKGTYILGSYGRIDMRGIRGEKLIVESEWNKWKFVNRTSRRELWDVTEESFKAAIQEVING